MADPVKSNQPKSVLHDIYAWSIGRPAWQSDALRRIITKEKLDESDRTELEHLCRQTQDALATNGDPLVAVALAPEHLPAGPNAQASVSIEYLNNLTGVNRLPSGQKITFGLTPGLTVVYGDNGTGKSGYVRIIKKACRTRGAPPVIQPDAFAAAPPSPACDIGIKIANGSAEVKWQDGKVADEKLSNVFVFDSVAASHYLESDGPASFTPYGLDVLTNLSKICDVIAEKLNVDIGALEREIAAGKLGLEKHQNTVVGGSVVKIDAKTQVARIMLLGNMSEADTKRLSDLRTLLSSDPRKKAQETRAAKTRIDDFKTKLDERTSLLAADRLEALKKCFETAATTALAAKSSAQSSFDDAVLIGTGSDLWRAMWDAAREFSTEHTYPNAQFPQTDGDARCVLCQRPFNADKTAITRAHAFEAFCNEDIQKAAKSAAKKLTDEGKLFSEQKSLKPDLEKITADLNGLKAEELKLLIEFVTEADDCLATAKKSIIAKKWSAPTGLPKSRSSILTTQINALETQAKTEESAHDPKARATLQSECNELVAKEWLNTMKADIEAQILRYQKVEKLRERLQDTKTNSITTKNSALAKELVSDAYCQRFTDEVKVLGVKTVQVKLEEVRSMKGEKRFGIRLVGAKGSAAIREIVSEGEHRCISLAAFLAELSQASHQSALIFDDPVSSLDHSYRLKIAARLAKEAKQRQVIIFTHDTVFLNDLVSVAEESKTPCETLFLEWEGNSPGKVETGLPWDCKSPQDRLDRLEKEQKTLAKAWQPMPNEELKAGMKLAYSHLRATIERTVEKVVFGDVVFRFRSYVNIKNLGSVVGFLETENGEIQRLFKKCCEVTEAHDGGAGRHAAVPDPADLAKDIADTKALLDTIRARHKPAAKATAPGN
jgi:energy-coupling factor transporter ATP-binding protein EcfA2